MPDREKVIKGLDCCASMNGGACRECPYSSDCIADEVLYQTGTAHLAADALALLKEQDAVKPKSKVRHGANAQIQHFCGNCNSMLNGKPKFCSECGRAVKWE